MFMKIERCFCPSSLREAAELLGQYGPETKLCAGGTDLFVMMRKGSAESRYLMDLSGAGLDYIRGNEDGTVSIGAMATLTEIHRADILRREPFFCLREAVRRVGSRQIRNVATAAGNVCTGLPSADAAVALLALDARLRITGTHGSRECPVSEFFLAPREIALGRDELVAEIVLPRFEDDGTWQSRFRKVGPRKELFISILSLALCARRDRRNAVREISIAMGVMAPVPIRLVKTEAFLVGKRLDGEEIREALAIAGTEVRPRSSSHGSESYRRRAAENLLRKYLMEIRETWNGEAGK